MLGPDLTLAAGPSKVPAGEPAARPTGTPATQRSSRKAWAELVIAPLELSGGGCDRVDAPGAGRQPVLGRKRLSSVPTRSPQMEQAPSALGTCRGKPQLRAAGASGGADKGGLHWGALGGRPTRLPHSGLR